MFDYCSTLILKTCNTLFVLSSQSVISIGRGNAENGTLKKLHGWLFSNDFSQAKSGSQEDDQISIFGCSHSFFFGL